MLAHQYNNLLSKFFTYGIVLLISSCTHSLHLSHVSDFSPTYKKYNQGDLIKSHSSQFVIMGFVMQNDYVNLAYDQLIKKCPNGPIQGITTQYSTDHGFFSWTNHIEMQGLCISSPKL